MPFKPTFYWTFDTKENAERINRPHIEKEGQQENRIAETFELIEMFKGVESIEKNDAFNIQNFFLKRNNYKGIKPGIRTHNVGFSDTPDHTEVSAMFDKMFPVYMMDIDAPSEFFKNGLLKWYKDIQTIHPLSDLNGRVFGTIVAILYQNHITKNLRYRSNDELSPLIGKTMIFDSGFGIREGILEKDEKKPDCPVLPSCGGVRANTVKTYI